MTVLTGDTKQLTILKRITELLEGITPSNGYDYDLTGRVFRGRMLFGANDPTPFVSILEAPRPDPTPSLGGANKFKRVENWDLLIQGWVKTNTVNPTDDLYGLKGSLEHRLYRTVAVAANGGSPVYPEDYLLGRPVTGRGGLIAGLRIGPGVVRAIPQTVGTEALYLPVTVEYSANVSDPWALVS